MKNKWFLALISIMVLSILSACSIPSIAAGKTAYSRTIYSAGTGKVYLSPDIAYVTVGVETRADQVSNALSENNEKSAAIAAMLQEFGVAAEDIQTSAFSVYPQQEYGPDGQPTVVTYVVSNTVFVTVRQLQNLGELLDGVVRSGANTIYGVQFDVEDRDEAIEEARRLAIADAKENAIQLAEAADVELGVVISVNVYNSTPSPLMDGKGLGGLDAQVPVAAGQMVITANADMTYEIR
jgi:uncharacterized protein YggE